jgi:cytochrome c peroxidase
LRCNDGSTHLTSDPGQALVTGRCADIGKFKVSSLRGLAAHPPYFHNGTAATLADVVTFYDTRFIISLSEQERQDLAAFLGSL